MTKPSPKLLSREDAKIATFARDKTCVFCDLPPVDAHHILDRKLWPDGGYYLDNLVGVCDKHHRLCEECLITVEEVREAAGITRIVVPPGFDPETIYDKWGNKQLPDGRWIKGPLFEDTAVQKLLKRDLWKFEDPESDTI